MKFSEDAQSKQHIQSFDNGVIIIADQTYHDPIIVNNDIVCRWQMNPKDLDNIDITPLLVAEPELVLLGLGDKTLYPRALMQQFVSVGVGIEVMTTASACRTFNLVLGEGRRVTAGLIPS